MKRFYEKNEIWFAVILIAVYTIGKSLTPPVNEAIGINYLGDAIFCVLLTAFLLWFICANKLTAKYKLQKPTSPAARFLYYIPLAVIVSLNLFNGIAVKLDPAALTCYIVEMFFVGIIEELLFRGLLFEAIAKDNLKTAIVVSSVTFGIGHILNFLNGVSTSVLETLCQIVGAISVGFLFVVIYHRGGSMIPCILAHSGIDVTSAFSNLEALGMETELILFAVRIVIIVSYTLILLKTLPQNNQHKRV